MNTQISKGPVPNAIIDTYIPEGSSVPMPLHRVGAPRERMPLLHVVGDAGTRFQTRIYKRTSFDLHGVEPADRINYIRNRLRRVYPCVEVLRLKSISMHGHVAKSFMRPGVSVQGNSKSFCRGSLLGAYR